jgi:hypothetical protein
MTEEELSKSRWWWRRSRFRLPENHKYYPQHFEWRNWRDGLEQTAFEYELVRRVFKTRKLLPFVELDCWIQGNLHSWLCPPRKKSIRIIRDESTWHCPPGEKPTRIDKGDIFPHGLSEADADGWRLNLEVTDNQLLEDLRGGRLPTEAEINAYFIGQIDRKQFYKLLEAKKAAVPSKAKFIADSHWTSAKPFVTLRQHFYELGKQRKSRRAIRFHS